MCVNIYIYIYENCLFWIVPGAKGQKDSMECLLLCSRISCLREVHENKYLLSSTFVNLLCPVWWQDSNNRATVFVWCGVSGLWPLKCSQWQVLSPGVPRGCRGGWMRAPGWCCCASPEGKPAWGLMSLCPEIHTLMCVGILMCLEQVQCPGALERQSLGRLKSLWNWVLIALAWRALKIQP